MNKLPFYLTRPTAGVAGIIEHLIIKGKNSTNLAVKGGCRIGATTLGVTVFPTALLAQLIFRQTPKTITAFCFKNFSPRHHEKYCREVEWAQSHALGLVASPLGLISADAVSSFFVKKPPSNSFISPFGVAEIFGKAVTHIHEPTTIEELRDLVLRAKSEKLQISVIGSGMSQGIQTVPVHRKHLVINCKKLNVIDLSGIKNNTVTAQAGATLEQLQLALNPQGKSLIVKQASDIFSIAGTIGINAHGWAHSFGSIASTVESIDIIDADGELRKLTRSDELFGCMFGTLGYFGIIVSVKLKITDNEHLLEKTDGEIELEDFVQHYEKNIKHADIPLFGGRLVLDDLGGNPFRKVCMVRYERDTNANEASKKSGQPVISENFKKEPKRGVRMERIALQILAHTSGWMARLVISKFWEKEKALMLAGRKITRNEALHPPINAFMMLKHSILHAQWLQEYFIKPNDLAPFLRYLGAEMKANGILSINATIRVTPKDNISILPYAEQDRYAVVICFRQLKTDKAIQNTKNVIENIHKYLVETGNIYYQAYMPFSTRDQFEACYGKERLALLRRLKEKYDPDHLFGNAHTAKYFDAPEIDESARRNENSVSLQTYQYARTHLKTPVQQFLSNIFQQVHTPAFYKNFEEIMDLNPLDGMAVYKELQRRAPQTQGGRFWKLKMQLKALRGELHPLLANIAKISDPDFNRQGGVVEIGLPGRHIKGVSKAMGLKGKNALVNERESFLDIAQCGFPRPYARFIPYTAAHHPLSKEQFPDPVSVVLMAAGLHHCPKANLHSFLNSIYNILEPGGLFLLRDHDASTENVKVVADIAHRFFNVLTGVKPQDEESEVRNFASLQFFIDAAHKVGFKVASSPLMREGDPTINCLIKFYKPAESKTEAEIGFIREKLINACNSSRAAKKYVRKLMQTSFSRVEWFNVESESSLANFLKTHSFWQYPHMRDANETAAVYIKSLKAALKSTSVRQVLTSDYNVMNSTILAATSIHNITKGIFHLGLRALSHLGSLLPQHEVDDEWEKPARYYAEWMKKYSDSLEVIPFYEHPYAKHLSEFFTLLKTSYRTVRQKKSCRLLLTHGQTYTNLATAVSMTGDLLWRQLFASLVKTFYGGQESGDARDIGLIIKCADHGKVEALLGEQMKAKVSEEGNPYAGIIVPRYRALQNCLQTLSTNNIEIVEIAGQRSIEMEFLVDKGQALHLPTGIQELYRRKFIEDDDAKELAACTVPIRQLSTLMNNHSNRIHRIYDF